LPMMYVFNTCKDFIRTIPNLVYDLKKVEDINSDQEDHIYDETRYICMAKPIKSRKNMMAPRAIETFDPLGLIERPKVVTPYDGLGRIFNTKI